jgi:hypothetical protein
MIKMAKEEITFLDIMTGERKNLAGLLEKSTPREGITIGTESDNDIPVENCGERDIRLYHARIYFPNGGEGKPVIKPNEAPVYVEDSENGTLQRVSIDIGSGREIDFGQVFYLGQNGFGFVIERS